ncbi:MAG: hypothetical protein GWM90_26990, partial [Gemmatimonadetes bacterium]|nr:hypothetical protein [Gemmatimonadota bacterium]NIQ57369.1 hypothetical protein [Gemmatimonadota bacterium]NIU77533.1 hypothetical protein [Gammaproteobacteria bacterium]NIX47581.1 hypothetical protein [Gemmatimonadota bacterium]NIY11084.1 hypothetical protein [Gemmatimonadota bacterium]
MHRTFHLRSAALALLLATLAGSLAAQSHRAAITVTGGRSVHDDLTPGLAAPTILESGWVTGLQAEAWLGSGRVGVRLNGLYARRPLEDEAAEYTVTSGDLDLLLRLLPTEVGRWFSPYLAAGGGLTRYAAADSVAPIADGAYGEDPVRVHGLAGIGADIGVGHRAGLRLEVADQIVFPSIGESPPTVGLPSTHNLVMTAGLQLRLGSIWGRGLRGRPRTV